MRLVLDTNTVVSGLLWGNRPRQLIDAALAGRITLFTSPALLLELEDVLSREKLASRVAASRFSASQLIAHYAVLARAVTPPTVPRVVPNDPDDDQLLACALAAHADLIVSGDKHDLLPLGSYHGIAIVTAADAVTRINVQRNA